MEIEVYIDDIDLSKQAINGHEKAIPYVCRLNHILMIHNSFYTGNKL